MHVHVCARARALARWLSIVFFDSLLFRTPWIVSRVRAPNSSVLLARARARLYDISGSRFPFSFACQCSIYFGHRPLPLSSLRRTIWLSSWNSTAISRNARPRFPISLPAETYVALESERCLSQIIAAGVFFDLARPASRYPRPI